MYIRFGDLLWPHFIDVKKQGLKRHRRNAEVKRSETAGVSNASKAVVFEDRKCSLDFLFPFLSRKKVRA
jgi:hypothetical protein